MKERIYYDRQASASLLGELAAGGVLRPLVDLARTRYLMDLQDAELAVARGHAGLVAQVAGLDELLGGLPTPQLRGGRKW